MITAANIAVAFDVLALIERAGMSFAAFRALRESGVSDEQLVAALNRTIDLIEQHQSADYRRDRSA